MDFKNSLVQLAQRAEQLKSHILTEEATKTSVIMPFFQILGYDIFNPMEFLPEYTCDVAGRKGEKIDYAILQDGLPIMLIEAKPYDDCLEKHAPQLIRYFAASDAKFAVLTNGLLYKFYTDLEKTNIMDDTPFFEFNLSDFRDDDVFRLKKFRKGNFDISAITDTAEELKYRSLTVDLLNRQLESVEDEFLNYVISQVWPGRKKTNYILNKFRPWVQQAFNDMVEQTMEDRLLPILKSKPEANEPEPITDDLGEIEMGKEVSKERMVHPLIITPEEIESYAIIKNLLLDKTNVKDISYKDTSSYFAIIYKNSVTRWVCRLYLSENRRMIVFPTDDKKSEKIYIKNIYEIANYKDKIIEALKRYM